MITMYRRAQLTRKKMLAAEIYGYSYANNSGPSHQAKRSVPAR